MSLSMFLFLNENYDLKKRLKTTYDLFYVFFMFLFTYFMIILWLFFFYGVLKDVLKKNKCVDVLFSLMFVLTFF